MYISLRFVTLFSAVKWLPDSDNGLEFLSSKFDIVFQKQLRKLRFYLFRPINPLPPREQPPAKLCNCRYFVAEFLFTKTIEKNEQPLRHQAKKVNQKVAVSEIKLTSHLMPHKVALNHQALSSLLLIIFVQMRSDSVQTTQKLKGKQIFPTPTEMPSSNEEYNLLQLLLIM